MRVLLDTCVIVDTLQARQPFCEAAQAIFLQAANERFQGFITANSVADIYYLTHRLTHNDKETRKILTKLFSLFTVADTAGADCLHAIPSPLADYEDAMMVETAKRLEMDCVVTRNILDYREADIPVYSPDAFLAVLSAGTD